MDEILEIYNKLFFLRPIFLWLFVPLGVVFVVMLFGRYKGKEWNGVIAEHLIESIKIKTKGRSDVLVRFITLLGTALGILAAAGPTWEEIEKPSENTEESLFIALDLSYSMDAEDIKPSRLGRAKMKLKDFLDSNPGTQTSLVVFSGTAHVAVPLTKDYRLILDAIDAIKTSMMPISGTNTRDALYLVDSLMAPLEAPSTLMLLTDSFTEDVVLDINEFSSKHSVEIMAIGTPSGDRIPYKGRYMQSKDRKDVYVKLDLDNVNALNSNPNVNVVPMTLDESDVQILAKKIRSNLEFKQDPEKAELDWIDMGYWLIIPFAFFILITFRRGWYINWVILLGMFTTSCSDDFQYEDLWYTRNQQGINALNNEEYEKAIAVFTDVEWKANTALEMGDTIRAMEFYANSGSAEGFYNVGVLLTSQGKFEEAVDAFAMASLLNPDKTYMSKAVDSLVNYINSTKPKEEPEFKVDMENLQEVEKDMESGKGNDENSQEIKDDEAKKEEANSYQESQIESDEQKDEDAIAIPKSEEEKPEVEIEAKQSLLRLVEPDPSEFMRRKFLYQSYMMFEDKKLKTMKEPW